MSDAFRPAPPELGERGEEMIQWYMGTFGVFAIKPDGQSGSRGQAIETLVAFTKGIGQPPIGLFMAFPEMAMKYFMGLAGQGSNG